MLAVEDGTAEGATADRRLWGEVVYLYAFDVANEIRLDRVSTVLSDRPAPFAVKPDRAAPRSASHSRPLAVEPQPPAARLHGLPVRILVHVYAVGVVSVTVRAAVAVDSLAALVPFHTPTLDDGRPLDVLAWEVCAEAVRGSRRAWSARARSATRRRTPCSP